MEYKFEKQGSVLMFCASFFGYDKRISEALRSEGYDVDLVEEKPSSSFIAKTCIRYNVSLYRPAIRKYIESVILQNGKKQYKYVLVVKGEAISKEAISLLRKAYPKAKFILYLWDSVANIPACEKRMKLYDRVLTFDPQDAKKYDIPYLPIPYDKKNFDYCIRGEYQYDAAFIGTAHSVRPRVVKQIQSMCRQQGRSCFVYFYSPHILVYMFNKLTNPDYRWIKLRDVHFEPLSGEQVNEIFASSRCVLDIEHPKQSGATTRPIEMLPLRKKIITTNRYVMDFPFYNRNNFCIVDRENPVVDELFWEQAYIPVDEETLECYSPRQFAKKLIE